MAARSVKPLIVIVGPTASGKTSAAIAVAKKYDGEIVCADSRTVYIGMDIGTAKPTTAEQQQVPHHLLDVVSPDTAFTVADFKRLADTAIADIRARGKMPILVGGSGLYVDSVIYDYDFSGDISQRSVQNPRHRDAQSTRKNVDIRPDAIVIGIQIEPDELRLRSEQRAAEMFKNGLIEETATLLERYGEDLPQLQAPAYRAARGVMDTAKTIEQAIADCVTYDAQLAKKQRTWFKRNNSIQWVDDPSKVVDFVTTLLNNTP